MSEVVIADNTITGEGVVLAQRLEELAKPGGVCIQGAAYETVPKRLRFDFGGLGEQNLKGFDEPVRVYAVTLKHGGKIPAPRLTRAPAKAHPDLPGEPSIAVLPFTNMSGDPEQEYFSDGIAEEIITDLARFRRKLRRATIFGQIVTTGFSTISLRFRTRSPELLSRHCQGA